MTVQHGRQPLQGEGDSKGQLRALRKRMSMIFQDPCASLDHRMTMGEIVAEPLDNHSLVTGNRNER